MLSRVLSDDEQFWLVTVSFSNPDYQEPKHTLLSAPDLNSLVAQLATGRRRVSKTIKLRASDGAFVGVKSQWES
jgi:hypothetical protein